MRTRIVIQLACQEGVSRHRKYNTLICNAKCDPNAMSGVNPAGGEAVICDTAVKCDGLGRAGYCRTPLSSRQHDRAMATLKRATIADAWYR